MSDTSKTNTTNHHSPETEELAGGTSETIQGASDTARQSSVPLHGAAAGQAGNPEEVAAAMRSADLPESPVDDPELFCDARPQAAKPYRGIVEKFLNWARANSLWVLGFGTGCGAIELRPLMTSRFDASRFGVVGRPTPRNASVFVIGGYASVKTLKRIIRSYEQMQNPKWVIGLGSCTINGGMYWDSYNTINRIDQYIPVDVYITGCMPRPEAILAGFQELQRLIKAGKAEKANEYAEHFDWYKANQKKVITHWDMPEYNW